ncbi:MAG: hypothetical protein WC223_08970 [Bacteroidales bacterium]|jgi:hypothetical protein
MRKAITFTAILVFIFTNAFSQYSKELPNYILAKNSNFVVRILSMGKNQITFSRDKGAYYFPGTTYKKINPDDYKTSLDEGLYNAICELINERLLKLNMKPSAFQYVTKSEYVESMSKYKDNLQQLPAFILSINFSEIPKAEKAFKNGELTLEDVKPITLTIQKLGEIQASQIYVIQKANLSLADAFDELKNEISKKTKGYFIEKIAVDTSNTVETMNSSQRYNDMLTKINNSIESFPDENELKSNELLVINSYGSDAKYNEILEEYYPYKYKVINYYDLIKSSCKGYKYAFVIISDLYNKSSIHSSKNNIGNKTYEKTNTTISKAYYILKNLETYDAYYGTDKAGLIASEVQNPFKALKTTLELMKKYYKWQDKKK